MPKIQRPLADKIQHAENLIASLSECQDIRAMETELCLKKLGELATKREVVARTFIALEKNMNDVFLKTKEAYVLKEIVEHEEMMADADREDLISFLSMDNNSAPPCDRINAILKRLDGILLARQRIHRDVENFKEAIHNQEMITKAAFVDNLASSMNAKARRIEEKILNESRTSRTWATEIAETSRTCRTEIAEITRIREEEAAVFAKRQFALKLNIEALSSAVVALEKDIGNPFVQTQCDAAYVLKKLVENDETIAPWDRENLAAFLACGNNCVTQSGQTLEVLMRMGVTMAKRLKKLTDAEDTTIAIYHAKMKVLNATVA